MKKEIQFLDIVGLCVSNSINETLRKGFVWEANYPNLSLDEFEEWAKDFIKKQKEKLNG